MAEVFDIITGIRRAVKAARALGQSVGFVPTMGALHEGHAALVRAAAARCDYVVVSVFVNPTQFGPNEDFAKYPRTLDADVQLCSTAGAKAIFAPGAAEMYPPGSRTIVEVEGLDRVLCGPKRPGHFRGVCTVVAKLFGIVQPDLAAFGAKDAQQSIILRRMVRDLDMPIDMLIVPTVREADGLAMSSRNRYLNAAERALAPRIYAALSEVESSIRSGERRVVELERQLHDRLVAIPGARVDYASILDADDLTAKEKVEAPMIAAVAVFLGTTRLIDNILLNPHSTD